MAFALAGLIRSGAVAQPDSDPEATAAALDAATRLCHAGVVPQGDHVPLPHHHAADAAILLAGASSAQTLAILGASPLLPLPGLCLVGRQERPAARAPPARRASASSPRGPPATV